MTDTDKFAAGQPVTVRRSSGFSNIPDIVWDSEIVLITVKGRIVVRDEYGYLNTVSTNQVTPR